MLALSNRARFLHSQLCRLHSACKHGPAWGVSPGGCSASAAAKRRRHSDGSGEQFTAFLAWLSLTFLFVQFFVVFFCDGGKKKFVKSQLRAATRGTFKKTLTRNLMDFCTLQKASPPPKKASICATLHLNTTSPSPSSLFFVQRVQVQSWAITALWCNYCQPGSTTLLLCHSGLSRMCGWGFFLPSQQMRHENSGAVRSHYRAIRRRVKKKWVVKAREKFAVIAGRVVGGCQLNVSASSLVIAVLSLSTQDEAGFGLERSS